MKFEDIQLLWDSDCKIDRLDLGNEALKISSLHGKYYKIYVQESIRLRQMDDQARILRLDKYEFYTQGPTTEQRDLGWRLPPQGKILKSEVQQYIEADKDIIDMNMKTFLQKEKCAFVESCIKSLQPRGFNISNAIQYEKFRAGG